ncbi:cycloeucalenol cycloisomerase [Ranunculus cassubicifolius]
MGHNFLIRSFIETYQFQSEMATRSREETFILGHLVYVAHSTLSLCTCVGIPALSIGMPYAIPKRIALLPNAKAYQQLCLRGVAIDNAKHITFVQFIILRKQYPIPISNSMLYEEQTNCTINLNIFRERGRVPHTTFLLTHVCFQFYHVASNITLRKLRHSIAGLPDSIQWVTEACWILALSYFIAYLETIAISNFPYYEFVDRASMYKVGSLFYAIYFLVSFPMFLRIDEKPGDPWDLPRVAIDALGAAMLVTIILDLWRIFLGPIIPVSDAKQCLEPGLPWFARNSSTSTSI